MHTALIPTYGCSSRSAVRREVADVAHQHDQGTPRRRGKKAAKAKSDLLHSPNPVERPQSEWNGSSGPFQSADWLGRMDIATARFADRMLCAMECGASLRTVRLTRKLRRVGPVATLNESRYAYMLADSRVSALVTSAKLQPQRMMA
jgi:hypothetical protein